MSVSDVMTWITQLVAWVTGILSMITFVLVFNVVVGLLAAWGGVLLVREFFTYRWLAPHRRRRYLVRRVGDPTWSMAEIETWANQLSLMRRFYRTTLDRPAQALRFRLQATPDGIRYLIEGSQRIERVMENPALSGVEVIRLHPSQDDGGGGGPRTSAAGEGRS